LTLTGGDEQAVRVLLQPAVSDLDEAEDALDHPEAVLDLGARTFDLVRLRAFSASSPPRLQTTAYHPIFGDLN